MVGRAGMTRIPPLLLVLAAIVLRCAMPGAARAQATAAPPAISQSQAQQTLDVLKDDKKRAALIGTLETIAKAAPEAAAAKPALPIPIEPGSVGAQALAGLSAFLDHLSAQSRAAFDALLRAPALWGGFSAIADDPAQRAQLLDALWRLAAAAGCGLLVEWLLRLRSAGRSGGCGVPRRRRRTGPPRPRKTGRWRVPSKARRNRRRDTEFAPPPGPCCGASRSPSPASALDLLPVLGFAVAAHLVIGSQLGGTQLVRLVLLALVNAYAICRALLCVARMVFSPNRARLRLVLLTDQAARYVMRWLRRLVAIAVFGVALTGAGLLLGLSQEAHDAALKAVGLVVHIMLIVIVLEKRAAVARRLRAPPGRDGFPRRAAQRIRRDLALDRAVLPGRRLAGLGGGAAERLLPIARLRGGDRRGAAGRPAGAHRRARHAGPRGTHTGGGAPRDPAFDRARVYRPAVRRGCTVLIYALTLLALFQAWGFGTLSWLAFSPSGQRLLSAAASVAVTILLGFVAWEAANGAIERHLARLADEQQAARSARLRTLLPLLRTTLLVALLVVVVLMVLSDLGVNIAPLLAGAGVIGIAIGFGSQKLVQDVITGLFLLLENAVQVGDVVNLGGLAGVVELCRSARSGCARRTARCTSSRSAR